MNKGSASTEEPAVLVHRKTFHFFALSFFQFLPNLFKTTNSAIVFGNFSVRGGKREDGGVVIDAFLSVPAKCLATTVLEECFSLPSVTLLEEKSFLSSTTI